MVREARSDRAQRRGSNRVGDRKISRELLGLPVLAMTAELRDVQLGLGALAQRFTALEARFGALE